LHYNLASECMKKFLLIILQVLLFVPVLTVAQNKRKKLKMESEANAILVNNLKMHIRALSGGISTAKETGSQREITATQYITEQYKQLGVDAAGSNGYIQEFEIDEGKQPEVINTFLKINERKAELNADFFPLAFSAVKKVKGLAAVTLKESEQPWFTDLKEVLEENQNDLHFDMEVYIKKEAEKVINRGATALLLYNSSPIIDHLQCNKNDKSIASPLPILYITKEGMKKYCNDVSATLNIELGIAFTRRIRKSRNVVGFINNNATATVILAAPYNYRNIKNASTVQMDENVCGTASLIELARLLKKTPLKNNNYLILHFSAEDLNLFGNDYWLEHPTKKIKANYAISLEMEGVNDTLPKLTIKGCGISAGWSDNFLAISDPHLSISIDRSESNFIGQTGFYRKEIPSLFFYTANQLNYQGITNDRDKINYDNSREIIQYMYKFIAASEVKGKLVFAKMPKVQAVDKFSLVESLGIIPDYEYSGTGVKIKGVNQGKLAERAGLQVGDVIVQLGDNKFEDLVGYMQALNKFKKGDKTKLRIQGEKEFDIEF
jgi:aminopeptidase YwaD